MIVSTGQVRYYMKLESRPVYSGDTGKQAARVSRGNGINRASFCCAPCTTATRQGSAYQHDSGIPAGNQVDDAAAALPRSQFIAVKSNVANTISTVATARIDGSIWSRIPLHI
jgi:hypothetical protein